MRLATLLTFCMTLFAQTAGPGVWVPGPDMWVPGGYGKGNDYLQQDESWRAAYITGFVNGMGLAPAVMGNNGKDARWLHNCTKGMPTSQIAEIIRKDIYDSPAEWHQPLNLLGFNAMIRACKSYWDTPQRK
jgi:hypothetical protein